MEVNAVQKIPSQQRSQLQNSTHNAMAPATTAPFTTDPIQREKKIENLKSLIKNIPDFPKPGVMFWDIFSLLSDGPSCSLLQNLLVEEVKDHFPRTQAIIGLESRGFLFSFSLAAALGVKCIPVRKKGKLPGDVSSIDYKLEYGSGTLEIQNNVITPGLKCLIIDDLIATGGSITAAAQLLRRCKADVIGCLAIMELAALNGRDNIPHGIPVKSLITY